MRDFERRMDTLVRRGQEQRRALIDAVRDVRGEFERRRLQWRIAGWIAGGVAALITAAFKLFGRRSLAATVGRYTSAASLLLGLGRAAVRLRRFF